jgi:hypothetical protein
MSNNNPRAVLTTAWLAFLAHQSHGLGFKSTSRAQFLSASTASLFTSMTFVAGTEECVAMSERGAIDNPRYIQKELEMKYADGPDGNPRSRGVLVRRVSI